jgi:hypothetical protein
LKDYDEPTTSQLNYRLKAQIKKDRDAGYKFEDNCQDLIALKPDADLSAVDPVNYNTIYSVIKMLNDSTNTGTSTVVKEVLDQFQLGLIIFDLTGTNKDEIGIGIDTGSCAILADPSVAKFVFFVKTNLDPSQNTAEQMVPSIDPGEDTSVGNLRFELVFNHNVNTLVYSMDEIPDDIIMLLYEKCPSVKDGPGVIYDKATMLTTELTAKTGAEATIKLTLSKLNADKLKLADLEEEVKTINNEVEIANVCLRLMSGDNFKKAYEGKTLYQYLIDDDKSDTIGIREFLDTLKSKYTTYKLTEWYRINSLGDDIKNIALTTPQKSQRSKLINGISVDLKRTLNEVLTSDNYSVKIPSLTKILDEYKKFVNEEILSKNGKISELKVTIENDTETLKDEGTDVTEFKLTRPPPKRQIDLMTPDELSAEKEIDTAMLAKINDILGKTQNAELISKYTKYKSDYEAKLLQIDTAISKTKTANKLKPEPIDFEKEAEEAAKLEEAEKATTKAEQKKLPGKSIKPSSSRRKKGGGLKGGGPSDEYYSQGNVNAENQYNPYNQPMSYNQIPYNQIPYNQQPYGQQQPYGPQQPYGQMPYNPQAQLLNMNQYAHSNRALELTSKLAYYVSVELELYPGKSVNTIQMAAVKCGSTFERIREAWAEIMGYQYRPGTMDESYAYQNLPLNKNQNQTQNQNENQNQRGNEQRDNEQRSTEQRGNEQRSNEQRIEETQPRIRGGSKSLKNKKSNKINKRSVSCKIYKKNKN